jgi:hypothetical protein
VYTRILNVDFDLIVLYKLFILYDRKEEHMIDDGLIFNQSYWTCFYKDENTRTIVLNNVFVNIYVYKIE